MAREKIRSLRKLRNVSQSALAKAAGLTSSEISRIECGYRNLSGQEASAIAEALGVAVHEIEEEARPAPGPVAGVASAEPLAASAVVFSEPIPAADDDLNDPTNFRELPDLSLLEPGNLDREPFHTRLRAGVDRATKILHTSRVPAAVWRSWRDFEKRGQEVLRATGQTAADAGKRVVDDVHSAGVDTLVMAQQSFRAGRSAKTRHQQKSYNALFVDAARRILPRELAATLAGSAELRLRQDPSAGFMRHFLNVAQETLPPNDLGNIVQAIAAHELKPRRGRHWGNPARSSFN